MTSFIDTATSSDPDVDSFVPFILCDPFIHKLRNEIVSCTSLARDFQRNDANIDDQNGRPR